VPIAKRFLAIFINPLFSIDLTGSNEEKQSIAAIQLAQFHQQWWFSATSVGLRWQRDAWACRRGQLLFVLKGSI
jgi:hypothetical protein